jgi:hypothetical protein
MKMGSLHNLLDYWFAFSVPDTLSVSKDSFPTKAYVFHKRCDIQYLPVYLNIINVASTGAAQTHQPER